MPKISENGGPTDENQPGYYEPGQSLQSPYVVVTEEQYTDAMSRHGTDDWTDADQRIQDAWTEQHRDSEPEPEQVDEVEPAPALEPDGDDYDSLTYSELQAECRRRTLPTQGAAGALIERLREHDKS